MIGVSISGIMGINVGDSAVNRISGGIPVNLIVHRHYDHGLDYPLANEIIGHDTRTDAPGVENSVYAGTDALISVNDGIPLACRIPRRRVNHHLFVGPIHRRIIGDGINRARRIKTPLCHSLSGAWSGALAPAHMQAWRKIPLKRKKIGLSSCLILLSMCFVSFFVSTIYKRPGHHVKIIRQTGDVRAGITGVKRRVKACDPASCFVFHESFIYFTKR